MQIHKALPHNATRQNRDTEGRVTIFYKEFPPPPHSHDNRTLSNHVHVLWTSSPPPPPSSHPSKVRGINQCSTHIFLHGPILLPSPYQLGNCPSSSPPIPLHPLPPHRPSQQAFLSHPHSHPPPHPNSSSSPSPRYRHGGEEALGYVGHDDSNEEDEGIQPAIAQHKGHHKEHDANEHSKDGDEHYEVVDLYRQGGF